ncbi:putative Ig domain-containing protein, partial [Mucilaginibacter flavidus]|uniref:putative Ig domain-containing protein n=1 Tax=Mucilaginibacter flavidus TaxID=2949309 RepID=UPI002093716C
MKTHLPSLQKSMSVNRRFGKPGLLAAAILLCTGIALFAASKNGGKLNFAFEAHNHKATLVNAKKPADHNARGNTAQGAPISVSYSSSNYTFHVGTTILLKPTASGVAAPAYTSPVILGSGLNFSQNGLTLDAAGNMYVNDQDGGFGNVKKITADGSTTTTIGSGFLNQSGNVVVDKTGNVYVADQANVWKIPASGTPVTYGTPVVINNTFSRPFGVAADTLGNIYVTNIGGGVYKMANDGNNKVRIDDGTINNGSGITVDAAGNVYVVDFVTLALYEIPANGSPQVQLATGFSFPRGVAVDGGGNIYIDDEGANTIYQVPPGGGASFAAISGITNAVGVAVDAMYNVYVGLQGSAGINKFSPTGGYFISPALPAGLSLNNTTGVITGTPAAITAEKSYIISAYNSDNSVSDTIRIAVNPPIPVPVLSYTNPNVDTLGVAIDPIVPSATGVDTPGYAPYKLVANGFSAPLGIASDTAGNIYVADKGNNLVKKVPVNGSATVSLGSGFSSPSGVAVDAAGFIYVADAGNGAVKKMSADGLTITSIGSGFTSPVAVAVDGAGNVYVADAGAGAVYKILASDGSTVTLSGTFDTPTSIAVDKTGQNIYVSDGAANSVYKVSPGCGCPEDLGFFFNSPTAVALDPQGDLYVADADIPNTTGLVYKGDGKSSNFVDIGSTFLFPSGVAVDPSGNLFVTDAAAGILYEIVPSGGYFLATILPKGLKFNDTTGIITGTPTALSSATNYHVFAYNAGGGTPATVNIAVVLPPAPTLNYNTPNTYTAGTAITPLVPTSSFIAKTSYTSTPTFIGSGFNAPRGTAVDKSGNVFVADSLNNAIKMIPAGGGVPVPWGSGFSAPTGVAVDSLGFVYVSDYGNSAIKKIAPDGVTVTSIGDPIMSPSSVAVDAAGNVYATDLSTGFIYEIKASDGSTVTLNSSFALPFPTGIAADANYIYVSDGGSGAVFKFKQGGVIPDIVGLFNFPAGVAVDASGNLYVSDEGDSTIYRVPANGHPVTNLGTTGLSGPEGLSVDGKGNIYVADVNNNTVGKLVPNGGFYINRPLPAGLSFNSKTGTVKGTPTSASPAKDYAVTGYNSAGAVSALFSIEVDLPPPPTLSYTGPNNYTVGAPIVPLIPSSANVSTIAYTAAPTVVSSGTYTFIAGVAADKAGNVYVVDAGANTVTKLPAGGGPPVNIGSGFDGPQNVAVDAAGNVYVADAGNSSIKKIPGGTGAPVTIGSGFDYPVGVAVDAAGNVYVADEGRSGSNGAVYKIPGGSGAPVLLTTGITINPTGIAVDAAGNLFVIDAFAGALYELVGGTGTPVSIGPLFNSPEGVTVDNAGNVYVTDTPLGIVDIIPVSGGPVSTAGGLGLPFGIALDGAGNLYVSDANDNTLKKVAPAGGLFISPMLPAGLLFDGTTGTISGTPTITSPATNYTVTGYNLGGGTQAVVNIKVTSANDALLANLKVTPATALTIVPGVDYLDYKASVFMPTSSIRITAIAHGVASSITVNGVPATSGVASAPVSLNTDTTTVYTTVTAADGVTKKTY